MGDTILMTEQDHFDVWCSLTAAQKEALCVLADGRQHYCWKRATDVGAHGGKGCVNATAASRLTRLKLARFIAYGSGSSGGTAVITEIGQAVWDASVFEARAGLEGSG